MSDTGHCCFTPWLFRGVGSWTSRLNSIDATTVATRRGQFLPCFEANKAPASSKFIEAENEVCVDTPRESEVSEAQEAGEISEFVSGAD
jgi:hypothetical protein